MSRTAVDGDSYRAAVADLEAMGGDKLRQLAAQLAVKGVAAEDGDLTVASKIAEKALRPRKAAAAPEPTPPAAEPIPEAIPIGEADGGKAVRVSEAMKVMRRHIEASALSPVKAQAYAKVTEKVLSAMSPAALDRFMKHTARVNYHDNMDAMNEAMFANLEKGGYAEYARKMRDSKQLAGGAWMSTGGKTGDLYVDGGYSAKLIGKMKDEKYRRAVSAEDVYAHEFSHAIDGPQGPGRLSNGKEWQAAWKAEMADGQFNQYSSAKGGASKPWAEGWAEFGRMLLTGAVPAGELAASFPMCYKVWKDNGLVADAGATLAAVGGGPYEDIFSRSVDVGDAHMDIVEGEEDA